MLIQEDEKQLSHNHSRLVAGSPLRIQCHGGDGIMDTD